jgi:hypothetical protein
MALGQKPSPGHGMGSTSEAISPEPDPLVDEGETRSDEERGLSRGDAFPIQLRESTRTEAAPPIRSTIAKRKNGDVAAQSATIQKADTVGSTNPIDSRRLRPDMPEVHIPSKP